MSGDRQAGSKRPNLQDARNLLSFLSALVAFLREFHLF
jgi:hypothetical protein